MLTFESPNQNKKDMININNTFKSKVMKAAWSSIRKGFASNLSQALTSAWKWAKKTLIETKKVVRGTFVKDTVKAEMWEVSFGMVDKSVWIPKSAIITVAPSTGVYMELELASWLKF